MQNRWLVALAVTASVSAVDLPWSQDVNVAALPPVVVETIPKSGELTVDPSLTEIRVTFSKDMMDRSWSWVSISSEALPEFTGKAHYLPDKRTCVTSVKLRPGRAYAVALNDEKHQGFKDRNGRPALPYLLVFETRR